MGWRQVVIVVGASDAGRVEEILAAQGALAVTLSDAADDPVLEPLPGETPLWRSTCLTALFADTTDTLPLQAALESAFHPAEPPPWRVETLEDRDWAREWQKTFRPMRFGRRLWVCPLEAEPRDTDSVVLRMDPGLAFGTGTHATTALCLERLDSLDLNETRVLDMGCGSGILAIGAILLGARAALAVDIDPQAITATMNNARENRVDDRLTAVLDQDDPGGRFDIVIANILAKPLADMAAALSSRVGGGGMLVLSGILESQCPGVRQQYERWIRFEPPQLRDGWACLSGRRR